MVIQIRGLLCSDSLEERLTRLVATERMHEPSYCCATSLDYVSPSARDEVATLLRELVRKLECYPETFARAVTLMDAFLSLMKVKVKFLRCVAVTCLFIAAKLEEDLEHVPSVELLVQESGCGCSCADIQRMELLVMQKLHFDLVHTSPLEFLRVFHMLATINQMLQLPCGITPSQHLNMATIKLEALLCSSNYLKFKPSVLALAVLSCELKLMGCDWLTVLVTLQDKTQVEGAELSICWENVSSYYAMTT